MIDIDIEDIIPHRKRIKLIDGLLTVGEDSATTAATVNSDWPLLEGDFVSPLVLIETVAQTAGALVGWKRKLETEGKGKGKGSGWLVGIKTAEFFKDSIPIGTMLITTVKEICNLDNYNVFEGFVKVEDELIGRVEIQVYRVESVP